MSAAYLLTLSLGLTAALVCALALVLVHRASGFTRANAPLFAAFSGGVVVTLALVRLIPEALALHPYAGWLVLAGFGFGLVLHVLVGATMQTQTTAGRMRALAPVLAIAVHSTLDGTVYAVTSAIDPFTAISTATGLILHEMPETLICFLLLQRGGFSDRAATVLAFLAAGATTLLSAVISGPFALSVDPALLGMLFAVVAGLLLQVGASHLLGETAQAGWLKGLSAVFAGAGVAAIMTLGHSDGHSHDSHGHGASILPDFRYSHSQGDR